MSEELIDVLDSEGKNTGETKSRSFVHQNGAWHRAVHIWIINDKKELLIQRRAIQKESHPGKWDISAAGHVVAGETSLEAAVKEIKEELDLIVEPNDLQFLFTIVSRAVLNNNTYLNNEFDDVYLLRKNLDISQIKLQQGEVAEVKWISVSELKRVTQEHDSNYVKHDEEYRRLLEFLA